MGDWNLGSVSASVLDLIENVPSTISGIRLLEMADRSRQTVETYTGTSIGSNSIEIKFQNAILYLTIADTANLMMATGADVSSIRLGDFSENKGGGSNISEVGKNFKQLAMDELKNLGQATTYYKARG